MDRTRSIIGVNQVRSVHEGKTESGGGETEVAGGSAGADRDQITGGEAAIDDHNGDHDLSNPVLFPAFPLFSLIFPIVLAEQPPAGVSENPPVRGVLGVQNVVIFLA